MRSSLKNDQDIAKMDRTLDSEQQASYCVPQAALSAGRQAVFGRLDSLFARLVSEDDTAGFVASLVPSSSQLPLRPANGDGFLKIIESKNSPKELIPVGHGSAEAFSVPIKFCL